VPIGADEANKTLKALHISAATIRRAKQHLGIRSRKNGAVWQWLTEEQAEESDRPVVAKSGDPDASWYRGDTNLRAMKPDKPHYTCRGMSWEWVDGKGWTCTRCHPEAA